MAGQIEHILTLPTYDGRTHTEINGGKDGTKAEVFLDRLTTYVATIQPLPGAPATTDAQKIAAVAAQLKGEAAEWWHHVCLNKFILTVDHQRIANDWEYFVQTFRGRFFEVQSAADTVEDISEIRQRPQEKAENYVERLMIAMFSLTRFSKDAMLDRITVADANARMNAQLAAHVADPIANPLPIAEHRRLINEHAKAVAEHYVEEAYRQHIFQQVCRTVGRNATDEWTRTRAKKTFQAPGATIQMLQTALKEERTAHKRLNKPVNSVDGQGQEQREEYDEDGNLVSAFTTRGTRGARGGNRGGGRGRPRGGRGGGNAGNSRPPLDHSLWCDFCDKSGHDIKGCRTVDRLKNEQQAKNQGGGQQQQQRGGGRRNNNNNRNGTSATTNSNNNNSQASSNAASSTQNSGGAQPSNAVSNSGFMVAPAHSSQPAQQMPFAPAYQSYSGNL